MDAQHDKETTTAGLPEVIRPAISAISAQAVAPKVSTASLDALALLKALRRRIVPAIGLGVLLAAVVAGATYLLVPPAKYTTRAMLHAATETPRILVKTGENQSDFSTFQKTQLAMLRSRMVLNEALSQPEVAKLAVVRKQADPVEWLEKELQVDFANGSEILRISMSGTEAREPAILINEVVKSYIKLVVNEDIKRRRERETMLKATWNRYQDNLKDKRAELRRLSTAAGSNDKETLAVLQRSEAERLGEAEATLARTRGELRSLKVEYEVARRHMAAGATPTAAAIEAEIAQDPEVRRLTELMEHARVQYTQADRLARKGVDPALLRHRDVFQSAQAELAARRKFLAPLVADQLSRPTPAGESKAETLRERIEILAGLERLQADDVERLSKRSQTRAQASTDLADLREQISHADELAQKMGAEVEALNLELGAPPRVTLREEAHVPKTKDEMRQAKMAGMAGVGAFGLALFAVAFFEHQARRVDTVEDVVRGLSVRLVGTLPALPRPTRRSSSSGSPQVAWQSMMVESVDAARTTLMHAARKDSVRVVMIASALGGEGKTSLSCHLAASLARAGLRTLLVDCDLRRPSVHRLFDLPDGPGVCEILRGEVGAETAILPTEAAGLTILPAGRCDPKAIQALACGHLGSLLSALRAEYDFIVVDSSPVLPVADSLQVAQHVDAVLYSVLRDVSRMPALQAAHERLASVGIRPLGVIVAGTGHKSYGSNYYAYAGSRTSESA